MAGSRNRKLVPECDPAIQQLKFEAASTLGVPIGGSGAGFDSEMAGELGSAGGFGGQGYLGYLTAREAGSLGGYITKRLVEQAEQTAQTAQNTVL